MKCPICENGEAGKDFGLPELVKHLIGFHKIHDDIANALAYERPRITRTQHINEVNALRSQNKLK